VVSCCVFCLFCSGEGGTLGLAHARQVLYN
jgi:hypothetical protein